MSDQNELRRYVVHRQPMARSTKVALRKVAKRKGMTLRALFRQFINKTLHEAED